MSIERVTKNGRLRSVMPPSIAEVYKLILIKGFKPSIVIHGHETMLVLTSPGGDYSTNYLLVDGKVKWLSGVHPFRILK